MEILRWCHTTPLLNRWCQQDMQLIHKQRQRGRRVQLLVDVDTVSSFMALEILKSRVKLCVVFTHNV